MQQQFLHHEVAVLRDQLRTSRRYMPGLVAAFMSDDEYHIVLEHVAGGDLWTLLERRNINRDIPIGIKEPHVKFWIAQAVEAIEWLHRLGWAHRSVFNESIHSPEVRGQADEDESQRYQTKQHAFDSQGSLAADGLWFRRAIDENDTTPGPRYLSRAAVGTSAGRDSGLHCSGNPAPWRASRSRGVESGPLTPFKA